MRFIGSDKKRDPVFLQDDPYLAHVVPETRATQNVSSHLSGTMDLAVENCPLKVLENLVRITALLHDAGKLRPEFYDYMNDIVEYGENARKRTIDHTTAGGRILENIAGINTFSEFVGTAVYSHHGLQDCIDMESGQSLLESRRKNAVGSEIVSDRYFKMINKEIFVEYLVKAHRDLQTIISQIKGFMSETADDSCGCLEFYLGMFERLLLSVLIDSDWTDTACFSQNQPIPEKISEERIQAVWDEAVSHFETFMKKLPDSGKPSRLNRYRDEISQRCYNASKEKRNLYRLTVPTGAGKTFSSLRFALHHAEKFHKRHIIYVAPFNSILEQNSEDIRKAVGNESLVLEHHCNIFYEDEEKDKEYRKLTERWQSPIITTTAVQMLNTLFSSQKSSIRRMYNLCNSVIIFDEVQAFPVRGTELFNLAVNFLTAFCNTTVILCSATQPSLARLRENNLYGCVEMAGALKEYAEAFRRVRIEDRTDLKAGGMSTDDLSEFTYGAFRKYGSVLVVVNTKKCAKQVYEALERTCENACRLYHLSTGMCPENRREELNSVKQDLLNGRPVICVSTQLIEAGVDLSFGCVIRSLAGLDSIIQAAGRCNRHKEKEEGKVYIIRMDPGAERLDRLDDIRRAQKASEKLLYYFRKDPEEFGGSLDSEDSVAAYYREYFCDEGAEPAKYQSRRCPETTLEDLLGKNVSGNAQYQRKHNGTIKESYLNQAFRTAGEEYEVIPEDAKVTVIIPYDHVAQKAIDTLEDQFSSFAEQKRAVRVLQRYAVGISENLLKKLGRAVHEIRDTGVLVLSMDYYDKKKGVLEEPRSRFLNF